MRAAIEKWQATVIVLAVIVAVTGLTLAAKADTNAVTGLVGIANLVLGAGAVAHGVRQGSKATADPPPDA